MQGPSFMTHIKGQKLISSTLVRSYKT